MRTTDETLARTLEREGRGGLWRGFSVAEDRRRTNEHYEQPPRFFTAITGGAWNVYSCNLWEDGAGETQAQEQKLDLLAALLQLQPGQRILDVGCGWGGPLVYLAKTYGVRGVGLTLSPAQRAHAENRVSEHGVDVAIQECHWKDFQDDAPFDAVYTDEVIVHFNDLAGYFEKVWSLLRPGGRMLNKELHFTSTRWMEITPAMVFVNEIYGETGNYRTLHEELALVDCAGFTLEKVHQIGMDNYLRTAERWLQNMQTHRDELERIVGALYYKRFRTYLRIGRRIFAGPSMTLDVITSVKPSTTPTSPIVPARL
jgi:cyclopropane-fatty-acyl-phospholipid synthase